MNAPSGHVHYKGNYLAWKGWTAETFGSLSEEDRRYYAAEIRRTGLDPAAPLRVLEVGFGEGRFLAYASERKWAVTGMEVNAALVDIAGRKGFTVALSGDLGVFAEGSFDLVVCFDVLEHIEREALCRFISGIKRVLRVGGVLLARFPNGDSPFGLENQNGDISHLTFIGSGTVEYIASELAATVVFMGGQAQPLLCGRAAKTAYRMFALPLRRMINLMVKLIVLPQSKVPYCSTNMVAILRFQS